MCRVTLVCLTGSGNGVVESASALSVGLTCPATAVTARILLTSTMAQELPQPPALVLTD